MTISYDLGITQIDYRADIEEQEYPELTQQQIEILAHHFDIKPAELKYICAKPDLTKWSGRFRKVTLRFLFKLLSKI